MYRLKHLAISGVILVSTNVLVAQGTLTSTLSPMFPGDPPLTGNVIVYAPEVSGEGPLFTVRYEISLTDTNPAFSVGRIAGNSTAWAFDQAPPTVENGLAHYVGTTGMTDFQIGDMLANRTNFEVYGYSLSGEPTYRVSGPLLMVPEPRSYALLLLGLLCCFIRRAAARNSWN